MNAIETSGLSLLPEEERPDHVLAGVDLELPAGACLGLLGGNGAGKSTLIKLLLGLLPIGAGSAFLFGEPVPSPRSRRGVAYLPEQAAPFEHLTGREHLRLFGALEGLSGGELDRRVDSALARAGLEHAADLVTGRYSKGMKQKLEIERILLRERRLIFLDEPLTGLDIQSRLELEERLAGLNADGVTLFITSHEPHILERLCDHYAVVERGRLRRFVRRNELLDGQEWVIRFDGEERWTGELPSGGRCVDDGRGLVFRDRETAVSALASIAGSGRVTSFGPGRSVVEELLREVAAS